MDAWIHAYTQWVDLYPYGDDYADFPIFKLGWLGVQLFFLISGFVIFMTLDKTKTFTSYIYKRWLRLFPAMLIASILIYSTVNFFLERPNGIPPSIFSLLPGLTFTLPSWWSKIVGFEIIPLEGAFWSLYVEFKFYVIAGITYFAFGRKFLIPALVALFLFWVTLYSLSGMVESPIANTLLTLSNAFELKQFGWFASGAMFYMHYQDQERDKKWFFAGIVMMILSSLVVRMDAVGFDFEIIMGALFVSFMFALSFKSQLLRSLLQAKFLSFFGFISYPLYLIHENAVVAMTIKIDEYAPWLHPFLSPLPAIIIVLIAYVIANNLEGILRGVLDLWKQPKKLPKPLEAVKVG